MVECVRAGNPVPFHVTVRPNSAVGRPGLQIASVILVPWWGTASAIFATLGAWPVTVFMLMPLIGLAGAFVHLERHAGDFERLSLDNDRLILDIHVGKRDRHLEFNSQWVQVVVRQLAADGRTYLALRSHGKEVAFGRLLTDDERLMVGRELSQRLAQIKHY